MFAEHLKNHIPGNPNIIVIPPRCGWPENDQLCGEGTTRQWSELPLSLPDSSVVVQLMRPEKAKFDMRKFTWIGSANQTNVILVVRSDTGVKKWEDMRSISVPMGSTGLGFNVNHYAGPR